MFPLIHDKRFRFGLTSVFIFTLFLCSFLVGEENKLQYIGIFGSIALIFELITIRFGIATRGVWRFFPLPALFITGSFLLAFYFQNLKIIFSLFLCTTTGILNYILLLALNVIAVSKEKGVEIPLVATAKTFLSLLSQHIVFISSVVILKTPVFSLINPLGVFLVGFMLAAMNFSQSGRGDYKIQSLVAGLAMVEASYLLSFTKIEDIYRALVLVAVFYITTNAIELGESYQLKKRNIMEYIAIMFSIFLFVLLS
jgi:hypothetical protein